jgi:hypothetical protein
MSFERDFSPFAKEKNRAALLGWRVSETKVAVVRESHKLFLSLTGEFE